MVEKKYQNRVISHKLGQCNERIGKLC